jgi:hypothetical protein
MAGTNPAMIEIDDFHGTLTVSQDWDFARIYALLSILL